MEAAVAFPSFCSLSLVTLSHALSVSLAASLSLSLTLSLSLSLSPSLCLPLPPDRHRSPSRAGGSSCSASTTKASHSRRTRTTTRAASGPVFCRTILAPFNGENVWPFPGGFELLDGDHSSECMPLKQRGCFLLCVVLIEWIVFLTLCHAMEQALEPGLAMSESARRDVRDTGPGTDITALTPTVRSAAVATNAEVATTSKSSGSFHKLRTFGWEGCRSYVFGSSCLPLWLRPL